jgi:tetrapyrrole methylase family protein/MazG family protein
VAIEGELFAGLVRMARFLRSDKGCPWDRAQDESSLARCVLSEARELQEAVVSGDSAHIREEIGDVLFTLISMAVLAEEKGGSSLVDLLGELEAKMVRRHPHVFGAENAATVEEALHHWNQAKRSERTGGS